jgi:hypothetical protein
MRENGLKFFRFLLLISSVSPVFALLAVKGANFLVEDYNVVYSLVMWGIFIISFLPLLIRCKIAKNEKVKLTINKNATPCIEEYSTYILSIALPLCQNELISENNFPFFIAMIIFVLIVFYVFNLYYLNIFFYLLGYKLYKIVPNRSHSYVIISKKEIQEIQSKDIVAIRLTNSLFWEREAD